MAFSFKIKDLLSVASGDHESVRRRGPHDMTSKCSLVANLSDSSQSIDTFEKK